MPDALVKYLCPDCMVELEDGAGFWRCTGCRREYRSHDGVMYLLPKSIASLDIKENEKQGWQAICGSDWEKLKEYYLGLPYCEEHNKEFNHYRDASREFRIATKYLSPLEGKIGLDLGGSIGWAAAHLSRLGAQMVLADYNDDPKSGLKAAQLYFEHNVFFDRVCIDAERLPIADNQFDFVFCCAFIHHLTDPAVVINHIGRVLKPGGVFVSTVEAFCPCWMSHEKALGRCQPAIDFIQKGINEQVFPHSDYLRWFKNAGLSVQIINPRWDEVGPQKIVYNKRLRSSSYTPEILENRVGHKGLIGLAARFLLRSHLWRPLMHPAVFKLLRPLLLVNTQKLRIFVCKKL